MANVLLIVAQEGFQTKEFHDTKRVLREAGHNVISASIEKGIAVSHEGVEVPVDVALRDVRAEDYDAVFAIGGPGALKFLDNDEMRHVMREVEGCAGMPYGAICIAPRILSKAGVLRGKRATGWNNDGKLESILSNGGARYEHLPVVTDGRVITADGPSSAEAFGHAIAAILPHEEHRGKEYRVKVVTRSRDESVLPAKDGRLVVSVSAPREEGRANERVRELLAEYFHVPFEAVSIRHGHTSATKSVFVKE